MKYIVSMLAGLTLVACQSVPEIPEVADGGVVWQQHRHAIEKLQQWHISGRLAVNNQESAWNLDMQWAQQGDNYQIELAGPFGSGKVQLIGSGHGVQLRNADKKVFYADSAEELLYAQTGVYMPITDLRYWVLGIPAPQRLQQPGFDLQGQLTRLQQADWEIRFRRYTQVNGLSLPDKIFIARNDKQIDVRLVVDEWTIQH